MRVALKLRIHLKYEEVEEDLLMPRDKHVYVMNRAGVLSVVDSRLTKAGMTCSRTYRCLLTTISESHVIERMADKTHEGYLMIHQRHPPARESHQTVQFKCSSHQDVEDQHEIEEGRRLHKYHHVQRMWRRASKDCRLQTLKTRVIIS